MDLLPHVCVPPGEDSWMHLRLVDPEGARRYVLCVAWLGAARCACGLYALCWRESEHEHED